jgi:hypothetical protein
LVIIIFPFPRVALVAKESAVDILGKLSGCELGVYET